MSSPRPPASATWILKQFGCGNEALAGDLVEEYSQGRPAAWYWRQVLIAVLIALGKEVRRHKLLTVRAVIVGWVAWYISFYWINLLVWKLYSKVLLDLGLQTQTFWYKHYYTYPVMFLPLIDGLLIGWLVARLHRTHRAAMVLVYLTTNLLICAIPEWFRLTVDSFTNSRFVPYLLSYALACILFTVGILLGGLWGDENNRTTPALTIPTLIR